MRTFLSSSSLTCGSVTMARVPPGATIDNPARCVSSDETASNTYVMGTSVMRATCSLRAAAESVRSRTCVAPREMRSSLLCGDAVVMMGEKPDSFASWMAVRDEACQYTGSSGSTMLERTVLA